MTTSSSSSSNNKTIPALPPPPERSTTNNTTATARRNKRREQKRKKQKQEGLIKGDYVPSRRTLGLELVADPQLLAKNDNWRLFEDGGNSSKSGDDNNNSGLKSKEEEEGRDNGRQRRKPLADYNAEDEKQQQQQDIGGSSSGSSSHPRKNNGSGDSSSSSRSRSRFPRLHASPRDTPTTASSSAAALVVQTQLMKEARNSKHKKRSNGKLTKQLKQQVEAESTTSTTTSTTKKQTLLLRQQKKKTQAVIENSKQQKKQQQQHSSSLENGILQDLNESFIIDQQGGEMQETRDYLKTKGIENIKAARAGRVRSFLFSKSSSSSSKNNSNDIRRSASRCSNAPFVVDEDEEEGEDVEASLKPTSPDSVVVKDRSKLAVAFPFARKKKNVKSNVHAGSGVKTSSGDSLSEDESAEDALIDPSKVITTSSSSSSSSIAAAPVKDSIDGRKGSSPVVDDDKVLRWTSSRKDPFANDKVSSSISAKQQQKQPQQQSQPTNPAPLSLEELISPHLEFTVNDSGGISVHEKKEAAATAGPEDEIDDNGDPDNNNVLFSPSITFSTELVSPKFVRDQRAKQTVKKQQEQQQKQLREKQQLASSQSKRVTFDYASIHKQSGNFVGSMDITPDQEHQQQQHNNNIMMMMTNPAATTTTSPSPTTNLPMRDYFCTPTVSSSEIHAGTCPNMLPMPLPSLESSSTSPPSSWSSSSPTKQQQQHLPSTVPITSKLSNESPTGVDDLLDKPTTTMSTSRGSNIKLSPHPLLLTSGSWNSDDTEKTTNTVNTKSTLDTAAKKEVETKKKFKDHDDGPKKSDEMDANSNNNNTILGSPQQDIASPDCFTDNFSWFVQLLFNDEDEIAALEKKNDNIARRKESPVVVAASANNTLINTANNAIEKDGAAAGGVELHDDKFMKNNLAWDEEEEEEERSVVSTGGDKPQRQLFNATWDQSEKESESNKIDDEVLVSADNKDISKPPHQRQLFTASWDGKPTTSSPVTTAINKGIVKSASFDGSQCSASSQISMIEVEPLSNVTGLSVSNVELELDDQNHKLKVIPQSRNDGLKADSAIQSSTSAAAASISSDHLRGTPIETDCVEFEDHHASLMDPIPIEREGSYTSLSPDARKLLGIIESGPSLLLDADVKRGEEAQHKMHPPNIQCDLQPKKLFKHQQKDNAHEDSDVGDGTVSTMDSSPTLEQVNISPSRGSINNDRGSPAREKEDGNHSLDDIRSIEDASTFDDGSTLENTVGSSTLNSTLTMLNNSEVGTGCDAVPDMPGLAIASLQNGFNSHLNNVLNFIDKIDDSINGRVGDDYETESDEEEEDEPHGHYRKRSSRRRGKNSRHASSRGGKLRSERRKKRLGRTRGQPLGGTRGQPPAAQVLSPPVQTGDDERNYQVRFRSGTVVESSDNEDTSYIMGNDNLEEEHAQQHTQFSEDSYDHVFHLSASPKRSNSSSQQSLRAVQELDRCL